MEGRVTASPERSPLPALVLGALGVVYGDIGTSPLYAVRECFLGEHGLPLTGANILGVLSLIFWSLLLVISLKYLVFVIRADNRGDAGVSETFSYDITGNMLSRSSRKQSSAIRFLWRTTRTSGPRSGCTLAAQSGET